MDEEKPKQPEKKDALELLKWFAFGIGIVLLIGSLYFFYVNSQNNNPMPPTNNTNLGDLEIFNPSDNKVLKGWTLTQIKDLNDVSVEYKKALLKNGVQGLALWTFVFEDEELNFQVIKYNSAESLKKAESEVTFPFGMQQYLTDVGPVKGVFGSYAAPGNDPLALYFAKDNLMFLLTYYNQNGAYNATSSNAYYADRDFLVYVGERSLNKLGQIS
ncbi:MAG: hypothetical protein QXH80_00655 [Candidatus Nanoarchaeia archaeon]